MEKKKGRERGTGGEEEEVLVKDDVMEEEVGLMVEEQEVVLVEDEVMEERGNGVEEILVKEEEAKVPYLWKKKRSKRYCIGGGREEIGN